MVGMCNTFICSLLLLAIIHEGVQNPLHALGEDLQVDQQDDDENGSLDDADFLYALSQEFLNNEPADHDENSATDAFEGDILGNKEELRALVKNREVVKVMKWPKINGQIIVPYTIPSTLKNKHTRAEIARAINEFYVKTCIRYVYHYLCF